MKASRQSVKALVKGSLCVFVLLVCTVTRFTEGDDDSERDMVSPYNPHRTLLVKEDPADPECSDVLTIDDKQQECDFAAENCDPDGIINYFTFVFCGDTPRALDIVLMLVWLLILFYILGTTAENYFCPVLTTISSDLNLSPDLAGVTFLALGNGAPDVFSTIAGISSGAFGIAIGELLGAGLFICTVVFGAVALATPINKDNPKGLVVNPRFFLRDCVMFIISLVLIWVAIFDRQVFLWEAVVCFLLYVAYVGIVFVMYLYEMRQNKDDARSLHSVVGQQEEEEQEALLDSEHVVVKPRSRGSSSVTHRDAYFGKIGLYHSGPAGDAHTHRTSVHRLSTASADALEHIHSSCQSNQHSLADVAKRSLSHNSPKQWVYSFLVVGAMLEEEMDSFAELSKFSKFLFITEVPWNIVRNLTVPQVANWDRWHAALTCVFGVPFFMYCIGVDDQLLGSMPLWALSLILGAALAALFVLLTSRPANSLRKAKGTEVPLVLYILVVLIAFVQGIVWIFMVANEIVSLLRTLGTLFSLSDNILGLTVLAVGNSIGDLVADVLVTRKGFQEMACAACFAGPLFNMLFGLGISFLIATVPKPSEPYPLTGEFGQVNLSFIGLLSLLTLIVIIVVAFRFRLGRAPAALFIVLYIVFMTLAVLTEVGIVPQIHIRDP